MVNRFEVYLTALDPTVGSEIRKTRPCVIVSPNELNHTVATIIIAPMTTRGQPYPTRVGCQFEAKTGQIALDQIGTVDKARLIKLLGSISESEQTAVLSALSDLFAE